METARPRAVKVDRPLRGRWHRVEIPNPRSAKRTDSSIGEHQIPNKLQSSNPESLFGAGWCFPICDLRVPWDLVFGIWDFCSAQSLSREGGSAAASGDGTASKSQAPNSKQNKIFKSRIPLRGSMVFSDL
jgi:hypothetical protein